MNIIVCLGNPGPEYASTRHNIGFRVADHLINKFDLEKEGKKFKSILYKGMIDSIPIVLIKPQTYMNLSGEAVQAILSFYKESTQKCLIIYDEIDVNFGSIRLRNNGGPGTHNGMKSIVNSTNSRDFPRIRVGVGPKPKFGDLSAYVLGKFTKLEENQIPDILEFSETLTIDWLVKGYEKTSPHSYTI